MEKKQIYHNSNEKTITLHVHYNNNNNNNNNNKTLIKLFSPLMWLFTDNLKKNYMEHTYNMVKNFNQ